MLGACSLRGLLLRGGRPTLHDRGMGVWLEADKEPGGPAGKDGAEPDRLAGMPLASSTDTGASSSRGHGLHSAFSRRNHRARQTQTVSQCRPQRTPVDANDDVVPSVHDGDSLLVLVPISEQDVESRLS
eukprot:7378646-Prymnesium_polylepis.2